MRDAAAYLDQLFRLQPRRALAWLESDYPTTATRFDFDA